MAGEAFWAGRKGGEDFHTSTRTVGVRSWRHGVGCRWPELGANTHTHTHAHMHARTRMHAHTCTRTRTHAHMHAACSVFTLHGPGPVLSLGSLLQGHSSTQHLNGVTPRARCNLNLLLVDRRQLQFQKYLWLMVTRGVACHGVQQMVSSTSFCSQCHALL